ncbi:MAG: HNH endonuclease [Pirellulales bacterium]|nr:HNH endonuclease [Pirellulales bacterium]
MHQSLQGASFHLEHVVQRAHGGQTDPSNLAYACPGCNLRKSDRTEAIVRSHYKWRRFTIPASIAGQIISPGITIS